MISVPEAQAVVRLDRVTKRFGGVTAVSDIDLSFVPGKVHSLVGENGAGKSTLMKIIAGIQGPDAGTFFVDGEPAQFASVQDAERAGIAMIPQELELFPELTVAENLFVGRRRPRTRLGMIDSGAVQAAVREVFGQLGVNIRPDVTVNVLKTANRQLVAIARALLADARVLIMDEPTASLTDQEVDHLLTVVKGLAVRGVAVIYISHRLEEIFEISDTVTVLRDGKIVDTAPVGDFTHASLITKMVGRSLSQLFPRSDREPGDIILKVSGLSRGKDFRDISFTVRGGEILGIAGLIGAGRTEIAHALFGLEPAEAGRIELDGAAVSPRSPQHAQTLGIAYVPEERRAEGLIQEFSVAQNISYASLPEISRFGIVSRSEERATAEGFARELSIRTTSVSTSTGMLSGGNQQKVVVAKALARNPSLLILDEPTRGVDVGAKAEIYRLINDLAAAGKAIILISSELPEVLGMSDRIVVLREGELMAEFDHATATAELIGAAATGSLGKLDVSDLKPIGTDS